MRREIVDGFKGKNGGEGKGVGKKIERRIDAN
jgi:hypothetical protein